MPGLKIPYLKELSSENLKITAARITASGAKIKIDKINWKEFPHRLDVTLFLGYCDRRLWLHYMVNNDFVRAVYRQDQDPVWQDSCVEFFLKQDDIYRNFEFNSLGVCLSAYGADRHIRKSLDKESMAQVLRFPSLNVNNLPSEEMPADWSLTVAIPLDLIGLKAGCQFWANFYKCGDETNVPHFISWSAIATDSPDFHRPEYFSLAELEI
jgi:hypothetical protein